MSAPPQPTADPRYLTAAALLSLSLHSLPGAAPAKERRQRAPVWLEAASILPGPPLTLILCYLCPWSPCHAAVAVTLAEGLALQPAPCALAPGGAGHGALAAVCAALAAVAPRPELCTLPSLLTRSIERAAQAIWPPPLPPLPQLPQPLPPPLPLPARAAVEGALAAAIAALQAHPLAAPHGALEGLALALSLIVCARGSAKAALICRPLAPWLMLPSPGAGASGGATAAAAAAAAASAGDGPFAQQSDADLGALGVALAGLPPAAALAAAWPACLPLLPAPALLLLHWLACLAPVHLVRMASSSVAGATASFLALHGPPVQLASGGGCPGSLPLWEAGEALALGAYGPQHQPPLRLFHGSATDNAHAILQFGLRSLSGTRHESSGSIFGAGVYLTGALAVAKEFAARRGAAWGGYSCTASGLAAAAGGALLPDRPTTLRPIFEVQLIKAPSVSYIVGGKRVPMAASAQQQAHWVPPEGAYIVVPNAAHLHISGLHIVSDGVEEGGEGGEGGGAGRASAGSSRAGGREDGRAGGCSAPWAKWVVGALLLAFCAYKLGALRGLGGGEGSGEGGSRGYDDEAF